MQDAVSQGSIYATTDSESQAAAIAVRLLGEGRDATTWLVADLVAEDFPIRSSFTFAVIVWDDVFSSLRRDAQALAVRIAKGGGLND